MDNVSCIRAATAFRLDRCALRRALPAERLVALGADAEMIHGLPAGIATRVYLA